MQRRGDQRSALRLTGAVGEDEGDEWRAVRQSFSVGSMAALDGSSPEELEVLALGDPKEVLAVWLVTTDEAPHLHHVTTRDPFLLPPLPVCDSPPLGLDLLLASRTPLAGAPGTAASRRTRSGVGSHLAGGFSSPTLGGSAPWGQRAWSAHARWFLDARLP